MVNSGLKGLREHKYTLLCMSSWCSYSYLTVHRHTNEHIMRGRNREQGRRQEAGNQANYPVETAIKQTTNRQADRLQDRWINRPFSTHRCRSGKPPLHIIMIISEVRMLTGRQAGNRHKTDRKRTKRWTDRQADRQTGLKAGKHASRQILRSTSELNTQYNLSNKLSTSTSTYRYTKLHGELFFIHISVNVPL